MPRYFPDELLHGLRNDISWASLLKQLEWSHKLREGQLAFRSISLWPWRNATL